MPSPWHVALLALSLLLSACATKPDAQQSAQEFFRLITEGKTEEAHRSAAFAFQAEQNLKAFDTLAREQGLVGAKETRIEMLASEPKDARFNVVITTAKGETRTFVATMTKDRGTWRLFSMRVPKNLRTSSAGDPFALGGRGSSFADPVDQKMPDEKTIIRLIDTAMRDFSESVKKKSFTEYYQNVSAAWQKQISERQLQRAFQAFIDQEIDLAGAVQLKPELDAQPQITSEGLLQVAGHYPSKPYAVEFALKFVYELPDWKLFGIDVNLKRVAP